MEQLHTDSTSKQIHPDQAPDHPLSDYVKRMETDENLEKLARKLSRSQKSEPGEIPDLPFDKFEQKLRESGQ